MRIILEGSTVMTGVAVALTATKLNVVAVYVRANHLAANAAAILVGLGNPQHYVDVTDKKGFMVLNKGLSTEIMAVGTNADVLAWTMYGSE